ncbi:MAG: cell division protein SepF [Candidatus Jordarchaeum sp.]|uniref:cell division protein SepF n=1 Tax=Candidatus Jordarchaeum sp. TaxID=2823881 RepID=UPI00404A894A
MGFFTKIIGKKEETSTLEKINTAPLETEQYLSKLGVFEEESKIEEIPQEVVDSGVVYIKSIPLLTLSDVPRIAEELKSGNIIIIYVRPFIQRVQSNNELKRAVDQLRGVCRQIQGDIAQLGNEYVLVTPGPYVKIFQRG